MIDSASASASSWFTHGTLRLRAACTRAASSGAPNAARHPAEAAAEYLVALKRDGRYQRDVY